MHSITAKIILWLIKKECISFEEYPLYQYAIKSLFLTAFPIILSIIAGIFISDISSAIILIIPYSILRKFTGGYHAKHLNICLILSSIMILIANIISNISYNIMHNILLYGSIASNQGVRKKL